MISVLYVDDEPGLLEITQLFLEASGEFTVATSTSAEKSLESLATRSYDVIISDYQMPDIDGIGFLKAVRKQYGDIPFILFTGRGREEIVIDAINNGADFYIQKGGDPKSQFAELAHKIRQAVRRREAERELRQSEARYRSVVNDQTEMIVRFTADGTITFTNEAYRSYFVPLLGLAEIAGKNIRDIMQIANYGVVENFLGSLTPETPIRDMERKITGSDGEAYWQLWSVRALFDKTGKTGEYQVVGKDISEQKRASAALADSESRLRSFIETSREAVSLVDEEGNVLEWNTGSERISGIKREDALGRPLWDLTFAMMPRNHRTEDRHAALEKSIRTMLRTGVPVFDGPRVVEAELPDGSRVITRQTIFPIRTGKGFRFGSIAQDITDEKREEDVLRESEKKYHDLAELLPQMIFEIDLDFRITYANWHTLTSLGFTEEDIDKGINALSFIDSSQHRIVRESVQNHVNGISFEPREYTAVRKDGSTFPIIITAAPVYRDKKLIGFRGVAADITARKKMEDALRVSEDKFRGMAERSSDLIIILNKEMSPDYVSPSARMIVGFDPEELVGKPPEFAQATIFSKTGPELMNAVRSTMSGLPVENVELSLTKKDKTPVTVSLCAVPVLRDDVIEGAQVTMRDITGQRKAELALRVSEAKFRSFVENASEIVFSLTPEGFFSYVSPNCTELLGYDPGEVIGKPSSAFIHPDDYPRNRDLFRESVRTGKKTLGLEYRIQHRDGSWRWYSQSISPVYDEGGKNVSVQGICHDITDRKQAESGLQKSEFLLSEAMTMAHMADWELDVPTGVFTFNDRFYALYGTTAEREGGYQMPADVYAREFTHPDDRHMVGEEIEKALSTPDAGYFALREHRIIRRDGEVRWIAVRIRVTKDAAGRTIKSHGANQDITERKKAEEALIQANNKLNLLSGITRHDINNQLVTLNGFVSLLQRDLCDPSHKKYFSRITESSRNIADMIQFTKEYEKIGTRAPVWQDLMTAIDAAKKGIVLGQITLNNDLLKPVEVFADPMLEKVFFNFLDNAVRHGERVTDIHVSSHPSGQDLVLVWEDNGIGIAADEKERIFERGFGKNTGLGMFLVREILTLSGITITETGVPGRGARFEMTIPHDSWRVAREAAEKQ